MSSQSVSAKSPPGLSPYSCLSHVPAWMQELSDEDMEIMLRNPAVPEVIDVKGFMEKAGNKPFFTRELLQHASEQLMKAWEGEDISFTDTNGKKMVFKTKEHLESGKIPTLKYNNYHILADPNPFTPLLSWPGPLQETFRNEVLAHSYGTDITELVQTADLPIHIQFTSPPEHEPPCPCCVDTSLTTFRAVHPRWQSHPEHAALMRAFDSVAITAPITRIVCLGLGSLTSHPAYGIQHLAAIDIVQHLEEVYAAAGRSLPGNGKIEIIAQDPAYTLLDEIVLACLSETHPISVMQDPDALLMITSSTLVLSFYATFPVKQIVADLAAESASARPAGVLWNKTWYRAKMWIGSMA